MERVYAHLSKNGCRKSGLLADPELNVTLLFLSFFMSAIIFFISFQKYPPSIAFVSSPELKAQVSFSDRFLSVVRLSVVCL